MAATSFDLNFTDRKERGICSSFHFWRVDVLTPLFPVACAHHLQLVDLTNFSSSSSFLARFRGTGDEQRCRAQPAIEPRRQQQWRQEGTRGIYFMLCSVSRSPLTWLIGAPDVVEGNRFCYSAASTLPSFPPRRESEGFDWWSFFFLFLLCCSPGKTGAEEPGQTLSGRSHP